MANPMMEDTVRVHPDVVWRELDGEVVLLNVATGLYYGLDETGSAVWRRIAANPTPLQAVRDALVAEFDGDPATIERDLAELVGRLVETQLLQISA